MSINELDAAACATDAAARRVDFYRNHAILRHLDEPESGRGIIRLSDVGGIRDIRSIKT